MEQEDKDKKNQPVVLPKHLAKNLSQILDGQAKKITSPSIITELFSTLQPFIDAGHERYKRQVIGKQEYLKKTNKYLEQFKTPEEKLLAVQKKITEIDATISEEKIRNYTGNMKYCLSIRNDILMPIKSNLKEEVEIRRHLPSITLAKVEKRDMAKPVNGVKLDIEVAVSEKVINHLIMLNKFSEKSKPALINAFYCLDIPSKIIWFGNANVWLTILYELKLNNKIRSSKKEIAQWIVKYFSYAGKDGISDFEFGSVYQTLNTSHVKRRVHPTNGNYIEIISLFS